jgi:HEAT repeat protein
MRSQGLIKLSTISYGSTTALHDTSGLKRAAAVDILGAQGMHAPLEPLLAALHDEYEEVRRAAVEALGARGARVPREPLLVALYDENQDVRCAAVKALGAQGKNMPIIPVMAALGDEESRVRHVAIHTLKRVYPQALFAVTSEAIAILNRQPSGTTLGSLTQSFIAEVIGDIGLTSPIILEKLTQLLDWPYWQVQLKAARALGKLRRNIPQAAIYRLLELSRLPGPKMQVLREAADDTLAEILSLETGIEDS